ncbi:hypothetical protein IQ07DRAFT_100577 [Pyrenochaeta sp. DS3sAY3a]|nr:hypothetical protein IQ07DRAFT_100577 [Pyrenochaeta sp. DS3sAY3a]
MSLDPHSPRNQNLSRTTCRCSGGTAKAIITRPALTLGHGRGRSYGRAPWWFRAHQASAKLARHFPSAHQGTPIAKELGTRQRTYHTRFSQSGSVPRRTSYEMLSNNVHLLIRTSSCSSTFHIADIASLDILLHVRLDQRYC